jgi:hypothetical protein
MPERFQYAVLRYVPNVIRDEGVNVGVVVRDLEREEFEYRFLPRSATVRKLAPQADQLIVNNFAKQLAIAKKEERPLPVVGHPRHADFFARASGEFTGNLQFSGVRGLLADDLKSAVTKIYNTYVAEPGGPPRPINYQAMAPYHTRARLWNAFRRKELIRRGLVEQGIRVEGKHAPWTFDLGYKNGALNLISSVALNAPTVETNLGRALVLKGMLADVRAEHDRVHGTAVAQLPKDRRSTGAKESVEILQDSKIKVVEFANLNDLVEEVARELQ